MITISIKVKSDFSMGRIQLHEFVYTATHRAKVYYVISYVYYFFSIVLKKISACFRCNRHQKCIRIMSGRMYLVCLVVLLSPGVALIELAIRADGLLV